MTQDANTNGQTQDTNGAAPQAETQTQDNANMTQTTTQAAQAAQMDKALLAKMPDVPQPAHPEMTPAEELAHFTPRAFGGNMTPAEFIGRPVAEYVRTAMTAWFAADVARENARGEIAYGLILLGDEMEAEGFTPLRVVADKDETVLTAEWLARAREKLGFDPEHTVSKIADKAEQDRENARRMALYNGFQLACAILRHIMRRSGDAPAPFFDVKAHTWMIPLWCIRPELERTITKPKNASIDDAAMNLVLPVSRAAHWVKLFGDKFQEVGVRISLGQVLVAAGKRGTSRPKATVTTSTSAAPANMQAPAAQTTQPPAPVEAQQPGTDAILQGTNAPPAQPATNGADATTQPAQDAKPAQDGDKPAAPAADQPAQDKAQDKPAQDDAQPRERAGDGDAGKVAPDALPGSVLNNPGALALVVAGLGDKLTHAALGKPEQDGKPLNRLLRAIVDNDACRAYLGRLLMERTAEDKAKADARKGRAKAAPVAPQTKRAARK